MKRTGLLLCLVLAAFATAPARAAVDKISGTSTFTMVGSNITYKTVGVSLDMNAQSTSPYPPLALGTATIKLTPFTGSTSNLTVYLYSGSLTDVDGVKDVVFGGVTTDGRCFNGDVRSNTRVSGTSKPATLDLTFMDAPCVVGATAVSLAGTGTTSFTYATTG